MKRFPKALMSLAIIASSICNVGPVSAETASPTITLNGQSVTFDVQPIVRDGRTYVPFRALLEKLGAKVEWDSEMNLARATKDDIVVRIPLNETTITVQDHPLKMDVPTVVIEDRVLVPLRFVSYALGASVSWNEETNAIGINQDLNSQLSQLINGQVDGSVGFEQATILFEWLLKGSQKGELAAFSAEKPPALNPYSNKPWTYIPAPLKAKGVDEYFRSVQKKTGTADLNFGVNREFWTSKYRVVEQRMYNKTYNGIGFVLYDQTRGTFQWNWEGYDIVAYLPDVK